MKKRPGFVSNSSSSSFCIYGTCLSESEEEGNNMIKDLILKLHKEGDTRVKEFIKNDEIVVDEDDFYSVTEVLETILDVEFFHPYDRECCYVGKSWSKIGDDETGKQFKEKVEKQLKKLDPNVKCGTEEEAWHC